MQVQIRHADGDDVSLEDCARFSKPLGEAIENSQLLEEAYVLEVSSPGISEDLQTDRDFQTFQGFPVEVIFHTEKNVEQRKAGLLHQRSMEHIYLNIKGKMSKIPRKDVLGVRLTSPTG